VCGGVQVDIAVAMAAATKRDSSAGSIARTFMSMQMQE
jgi:hypothetical protein